MADNNVGWGQGSVNNNAGWGSGASNNVDEWGDIHFDTLGHDETNLTGVAAAVRAYLNRVIADGGTVEGINSLNVQYKEYEQYSPSLLNIPSAYKASVMYSIIPANGDGDLSFTRNILKYRVLVDGTFEEIAANVPDLSYKNVYNGLVQYAQWRYEPQRVNLLLWSQAFDNAAWIKTSGGTGSVPVVTPNTETAPDGTMSADHIMFDTGANTTSSDFSLTNQNATVTSGVNYTGHVWLKGNVGGEELVIRTPNAGTFTKITLTNEWVMYDFTAITAGTTGTLEFGLRQGLGGIGTINSTASIYAWNGQLELGSYATSPIKTEGSQITRLADSPASITGMKAASLIGASEGSIGGEFFSEELVRDSTATSFIFGSAAGEFVSIQRSSSSAVRHSIIIGTPGILGTHLLTQDVNKWLFAWDASGWFLSINGAVVDSGADVFTFATDEVSSSGSAGEFYEGILYSNVTKDSQTTANQFTTI